MKSLVLRVLVIAILIFSSANANEAKQEVSKNIVEIKSIAEETFVPLQVFEAMDKFGNSSKAPSAAASGHGNPAAGKDTSATIVRPNYEFVDISATIWEKNAGTLLESSTTIRFSKGGGTLDLARFVGNVKGTFYFKIEYEAPNSESDRIYFVSQAKRRRNGDEIWGAGCNKSFELTKYFFRDGFKSGIKVNTTDERHISVLGGSFILFINDGKRIKTAQIKVIDSRHPEFLCNKNEIVK